ncbi:MAG: hypothetical protein HYX37_19645 [Rhizobiales bacterium]|nr:hypothetical protein [Hyphomicrobiales bacterium]
MNSRLYRRSARAAARLLHPLVAAALLIVLAVPAFAQPKPCVAPLGWWESKGLMPFFINPKGNAPTTDCDFQLWSWSAFVHFMQPDPKSGAPMFLLLPTYDDLVSDKTRGPIAKPEALLKTRELSLRPRNEQPKSLGSFKQAGPGGVLVDQNGRSVYYATHMDPIYFNFTQTYFGPNNYKKAAPTLNYPIGATVIKSSWRIVAAGETVTDAYTTTATIALLESDGKGKLKASGKTQSGVKVALVGIHVVGVIKDHPEFAWSTFEQLKNAPDLPANLTPNSPEPVSAQSYTFYKGGTPANVSNILPKTMTIDPATQVIAPITNVFQQFQYGGATPALRVADIDSINANFQATIKGQSPKVIDPVFANYRLTGTVWMLPNTLVPGDGNMSEQAIGSIDLDNDTLETFVQGVGTNCFSCHTTSGHGTSYPGKNINTSHIITSVLKPNPLILQSR